MAHSVTYGWIGIGNMGYGMAMNIATKKPQKSKLFIYDVNSEQMEKFVVDASAKGVEGVETAKTPREVAEHAVSVSYALTITHDLFLAPQYFSS
jgi:3-hydroxyisobutyrate dehydrogenase-like beta-hydroxyacid dehydrogenase